jgi:hypothetical protein
MLAPVVIGLERMQRIHATVEVGKYVSYLPLYLASWDRRKQEVTFAITNSNVKVKRNITFSVAFDEIKVVDGKEAVPVLNGLIREVEGILAAVEAEAWRLGFIQ